MAHRFFEDPQFDYETKLALGSAYQRGADVGEVLAAVERITDGDAESWFTTWTELARRVRGVADRSAAGGHPVSARDAYLRAAGYFATGLTSVDGTEDVSRLVPTFREHRACFEQFAVRCDQPAEQVSIPYEDTAMPGFLFRPAGDRRPRPTVIVNNGSDGPINAVWTLIGAGAVARGHNVLLFDGPGQQSMLFLRGIPFRYDWENVITPVVDFLRARPDVDPSGITLIGISQAGYWVPRALAFEHRIAAAVADPGVWDVSTSWFLHSQLPPEMIELLDAGERDAFDQYMTEGIKDEPGAAAYLAWRMKPYGVTSYYDVFTEIRKYTVAPVADRITTPMLITDPEAEYFWPGQSRQLYDALPGPKTLVRFTAAEGDDLHCEPIGRALFEQRIYDWIDSQLTGVSGGVARPLIRT